VRYTHIRLNDQQVSEVKLAVTPNLDIGSEEFRKVLTGRHADPNLLTVDEYRLVEKYIIEVQ
jgi:hypothetical protein